MAGLGFSPHLQDGLGLKRPLRVKGSKGAKWVCGEVEKRG